MPKNAYEIRLDVLSLAHGDLVGQYYRKLDESIRSCDKFNKEFDTTLIEKLYPSTQDIIARAEQLYKFVENNE